jgi:hypothetical protein
MLCRDARGTVSAATAVSFGVDGATREHEAAGLLGERLRP